MARFAPDGLGVRHGLVARSGVGCGLDAPTVPRPRMNDMPSMQRIGAVWVVSLAAATALGQESTVDRDEAVKFFPTFGWRADDGAWDCAVYGWVYERGHRRELLNLLTDRVGCARRLTTRRGGILGVGVPGPGVNQGL